jgi:hypothetical protein
MNLIIIKTILTQNSIKLLFKINLIKETRKKKTKNDFRKRMKYRFAFNRVLIETKIKKHRDKKIKNLRNIIQKQKSFKTKKIVVIIKKKEVKMIKQIKRKMMIKKRNFK